jgi:hypothetical protein
MPNTTDSKQRQARFGRAGVAALALLAIGASAAVAGSITNRTSSLLVPLAPGSAVTVSPGPCMPAGDVVPLAGNLHVVTLVRDGMLTEVHLNLAGVQGMGQTGNLYIGTGSQKLAPLAQPVTGGTRVLAPGSFTLEHTDGCASDTLPAIVELVFDAEANLDPAQTECTGGACPSPLR